MEKITRDIINCVISEHHYANKEILDWLRFDSLYDNHKDEHFDEEVISKQFNVNFKGYDYKEDSFNETDLDRVILEFEKTLKRLKEARLSVG